MSAHLGDNCFQNDHLGRYIVGYMVGNFVLRRRVSGAVKHNFRLHNRWYTSLIENLECGYPHSNALFNIYSSDVHYFAPNWSFASNVNQLRQLITSGDTYDVGAPTVHRRIYWHKFLTLSNQASRYIRTCTRIENNYCTKNYFMHSLDDIKYVLSFEKAGIILTYTPVDIFCRGPWIWVTVLFYRISFLWETHARIKLLLQN